MAFQKVHLHDVAGQRQQTLEIAQAPGAMMGGDAGGFFQFGDGMFSGQLQQALHDAQALWTAGLMHRLGPGASQRPDRATTVQKVIDAAFNDVAFAAVQMGGIGGELSGFGQRVQSNLFPARVVKPHQPCFLPHPDLVPDVFGRTLQWFRETSDLIHVPQLFALSIPGLLPGQTIRTVARPPIREDAQFWRQKAARVVMAGATRSDVAVIPFTGTNKVTNTLMQETGASLAVAGAGTFNFDTGACYGTYSAAFLVKPDSTVEIPGGLNNEGLSGTLGGASYNRYLGHLGSHRGCLRRRPADGRSDL